MSGEKSDRGKEAKTKFSLQRIRRWEKMMKHHIVHENVSDALNKNLISKISCNRLFQIGTKLRIFSISKRKK